MDRTSTSIGSIVAGRPPAEALDVLKSWRGEAEAVIARETAFLAALDDASSKLDAVLSVCEDPAATSKNAWPIPVEEFDLDPLTIWRKVVHYLDRRGSARIRDIAHDLHYSYNQIYYEVVSSQSSMLSRNYARWSGHEKRNCPVRLTEEFRLSDRFREYFIEIAKRDRSVKTNDNFKFYAHRANHEDELIWRIASAIYWHTVWVEGNADGNETTPIIWRLIRNYGAVGAVERIVRKLPGANGQLEGVTHLRRSDLRPEAIVLAFPTRFHPDVVEAARWEIAGDENPETVKAKDDALETA